MALVAGVAIYGAAMGDVSDKWRSYFFIFALLTFLLTLGFEVGIRLMDR